jgi:hypothetical protein
MDLGILHVLRRSSPGQSSRACSQEFFKKATVENHF